MKKNVYKILATACALTIIVASPAASTTSYAFGFNADAGYDDGANMDEFPDDYWSSWEDSSSSDSGSNDSSSSNDSYTEPSYTESTPSYTGPSYTESTPSYTSSSHDSGSSNDSYDSNSGNSGSSTSNVSSNGGSVTVTNANDVTVSVTGGQKFRSVMNADHTVYQVYHCGISRASFTVKDADGNVVAFSTVTLEQGEDSLWYENITLANGVDTKGLTVTVTKGDASYLAANLGVSGIKLNGTVALLTAPATDAK